MQAAKNKDNSTYKAFFEELKRLEQLGWAIIEQDEHTRYALLKKGRRLKKIGIKP